MRKFPIIATLLIVLFLIVGSSVGTAQMKQLESVPDFTLESTDGEEITLSELQGKVVVLHFWKNN
jgi:cytochrome oxidase Cu insertion factor (SCO1/SenC/PrrC family)